MFGNSQFDRVRQIFSDQFESADDGFIYRKSMKGAPIRVSGPERDSFVAEFNRRLRYAGWSIIPAILVLIGLLVAFVPDVDSTASQILMYLGIGLILAIFMGVYWWAWTAPARELERRPTLGEPRSRAEVRRVMLAKTTYGQLGTGALIMAALLFKVGTEHDLLTGWSRLWLAGAAVGAIGIAFQAYRKWRFDKTGS